MIWVKFPGLSLEYWEVDILMAMARTIGNPIHVDKNTLKRDNGFYASVLVDVNLANAVPEKNLVEVEDSDIQFWQEIQLGKVPDLCSNCKVVGHVPSGCRLIQAVALKEGVNVKNKEPEKVVTITVQSKN
ncbi:hypothetical protein ACHQM5_023265 [Ranunculus cassubicifolius]